MKFPSFRIRAISTFTFDVGMSTRRCFDPQALRIRVSMSAIGSVMLIVLSFSYRIPVGTFRNECLPAGLAHARDEPLERQVAEADAADAKLAEKGARASAAAAAIVLA